MRPNVKAALQRVIDEYDYRAAVLDWIHGHSTISVYELGWSGEKDAAGTAVMNICSGGPQVTVAVETIQFVLRNRTLPEEELTLSLPPRDSDERATP